MCSRWVSRGLDAHITLHRLETLRLTTAAVRPMRQAPSFAAEISSSRLRLAAIGKTTLIVGIFVEDQGRLGEALQGPGDKSGICRVPRPREMHFERVDTRFHVVLDEGKPALDRLPVTLIGKQPANNLPRFKIAPHQ